ncbi:DNA polymerase epsilon subunit 3-like [Lingula anatina]|uniref:DNA polymerase epsilon subunit 3 n=1 Tax=Lingula anatina TaxID=7574 RepID=A0A1S3KCV7_LINAN|nr:DNA polymerase epsilon subunit 3-like [Lingula anatina]XP_013420327.1 DNA polymerase epsilon subunit 3-like [Lingula anatina]|eukprot:XP_013420326.1 DNA polymerase epsilon subunit 3-like [Lingula anatina]
MAERPEDLNLPNAVVTRIIKDALPEGVNISKDARLAISKAASVFVLYTTSCANNFAMKAKRKTLTGQDVISAMSDMEFERFTESLQQSLEAFRKEQKNKKDAAEKRKKEKELNASSEAADEDKEKTENAGDDDDIVELDGDEEDEEEEENGVDSGQEEEGEEEEEGN